MKTDQLMKLKLFNKEFEIFHNSMYGNLNQLLLAGNQSRIDEGNAPLQLASFLNSKQCQDRINLIENDDSVHCDKRGAVYKTGRSVNTKTQAHILVLLLAAEVISSKFHYELHKKIVSERLLENRDESGDEFMALNINIDGYLPGREEKSSNKGVYIQIAKLIKENIKPNGNDWNTANAEQLKRRVKVEQTLCVMLKHELVRDFEHLRELASKV